jgi:hypothetical protein
LIHHPHLAASSVSQAEGASGDEAGCNEPRKFHGLSQRIVHGFDRGTRHPFSMLAITAPLLSMFVVPAVDLPMRCRHLRPIRALKPGQPTLERANQVD